MKTNNTSLRAGYTGSFIVDFCMSETHPSKAKSNARAGVGGGRGWRFYSALFLTRGDQGSIQFIKLLQSFFSWLRGFTDQKIQWLLNDF